MARTRVDLHIKGFNALRNQPGVIGLLRTKADAIARAAGEGHDVIVRPGAARARATIMTVSPAAKAREAKRRNLLRSLDAGR